LRGGCGGRKKEEDSSKDAGGGNDWDGGNRIQKGLKTGGFGGLEAHREEGKKERLKSNKVGKSEKKGRRTRECAQKRLWGGEQGVKVN